jgi:RNA polymerase sigma-70 factor (ECF subfamily)
MTRPSPAEAEQRDRELRAIVAGGDIDRATDLTIRAYGPELIGWLCSTFSSEADAHEAFSRMSEELWRSLARFDGRCTLRTWCYMLARHAAFHVRARPRHQHETLRSHIPSVLGAVTHVLNTARGAEHVQNVYAEIRKSLDEDDQTLLVLRVDRDLAWRDIAIVLLGEDADSDDLTRKAAALRKQFERVKERLRELAAERLGD